MARGRVKKVQEQAGNVIFALDIGTRSIIGMVGTVEEDKVKIIAIEKEEHTERAMIDGQIENIEKVAAVADKVKKRLEDKVKFQLRRVSVAAAGRALRTKRADFEMELPGTQLIDDEIISKLEAGAISKAEEAFDAENAAEQDNRRFYLVGYTICQYFLDQYSISDLKDHRGRDIKVDLIATFLPSEVVESLYTTMNKIGLEVSSITLEPIAAINAAIPENIRLLNLALADIGAGTSDIAVCTAGSVTGYTMATVAGDEITEAIMKEYLVDFGTADRIKAQVGQKEEIVFSNILGIEQKVTRTELLQSIQGTSRLLCREIADKILEINGGPPSALFLAGGGSKLAGLKEGLTEALEMEASRVAVAGNYFQANAYSEEYDLDNPEYATPLGIAISSGLNMINDGFRVILNGRPAKLFRSGSFTALNLLMMNGFNFRDMIGRSGANLTVWIDGQRKVFYGTTAQPASLLINQKEGKLSDVIHAGDNIDFIPAIHGIPARVSLGEIEGAKESTELTLNGAPASLQTVLRNGDVIQTGLPRKEEAAKETEKETEQSTTEEKGGQGSDPEIASELREEKGVSETEISSDAVLKGPVSETAKRVAELEAAQKAAEAEAAQRAAELEAARKAVEAEAAQRAEEERETASREEAAKEEAEALLKAAAIREEEASKREEPPVFFYLNDMPIRLPRRPDGERYYLMDLIEYSGIDLKNPKGRVNLTVNGRPGMFQQTLTEGDRIYIEEEM